MQRQHIKPTSGPIEYADTEGAGPTLVPLHGAHMNAALWDSVTAELTEGNGCLTPTPPMSAHRLPVHNDADLSLGGLAAMVAEFLERLNLHDVTLVGNDTGGAIAQILVTKQPRQSSDPPRHSPVRQGARHRRADRRRLPAGLRRSAGAGRLGR